MQLTDASLYPSPHTPMNVWFCGRIWRWDFLLYRRLVRMNEDPVSQTALTSAACRRSFCSRLNHPQVQGASSFSGWHPILARQSAAAPWKSLHWEVSSKGPGTDLLMPNPQIFSICQSVINVLLIGRAKTDSRERLLGFTLLLKFIAWKKNYFSFLLLGFTIPFSSLNSLEISSWGS